jgi:flagellar hook-associated protein 3 FlgL
MRISTDYQFTSSTEQMGKALERMFKAGQVVQTGVRVQNPSDDPFAASVVLGLQSALSNNQQYQQNIKLVQGKINSSESAISEVSDLLNEARTLTLAGANGTNDQQGRDAMVAQISRIQERLVQIGNTEYVPGQYLFAGTQVATKPFTVSGGVITYNGDTNTNNVEVQKGQTQKSNVVVNQMITDIYNTLETVKADLSGGNLNKLGTEDLDAIDGVSKTTLATRGDLGSLLQLLDATTKQLGTQEDSLKSRISDNKDADLSQAITEYTAAQNAYQAVLATVAGMNQVSLVKFMTGGI